MNGMFVAQKINERYQRDLFYNNSLDKATTLLHAAAAFETCVPLANFPEMENTSAKATPRLLDYHRRCCQVASSTVDLPSFHFLDCPATWERLQGKNNKNVPIC